jgi:hypothetical protein
MHPRCRIKTLHVQRQRAQALLLRSARCAAKCRRGNTKEAVRSHQSLLPKTRNPLNRYRLLAMQRHPDKNGNTEAATQAFQELQNAYSVLKDPNERSWCENYSLKYVAGNCRPSQTLTFDVARRYDSHREIFLRGDNPSSSSAASEGPSE